MKKINLQKQLKADPLYTMETNNEPTIKYSEEVYQSLLEQHELSENSNDILSVSEDQDPLALDNFEDIQDSEVGTYIGKTKSTNKEYIQSHSHTKYIYDNLSEHQFANEEMEDGPELIKIEIVEDDNAFEESSIQHDLQFIENKHLSSIHNNSDTIIPCTKTKNSSAYSRNGTKKKQKTETEKSSPTLKSIASTELSKENNLLDSPLHLALASIELNFSYNFNYTDTVEEEKLQAVTGVTRDILRVCEKCIENFLYTHKLPFAKSITQKVILVLMKLRNDLPFNTLASILGLKENVCRIIFDWTLKLLSPALSPAVCWFTRKELKDDRVKCFEKEYYNQIRVILHPLVFKVNKCRIPNCDVKQCEEYKKYEFVRIIIGLSPKGNLFSFVSNHYSSSISMGTILRKENFFLSLCNAGDIIVTTEIFEFIREDCRRDGITIKVLGTLEKDIQDYVYTILKKLEMFRILRNKKISSHMVPSISKVVNVVCSVLNLGYEGESTEEIE